MSRRLSHYFTIWILLVIYGFQVCPFLESLSVLELSIPIFIALLAQLIFQNSIDRRVISKIAYKRQSRILFQVELLLVLICGLSITLFNTLYHGFPFESGLKLVLAYFLLGFFAAVDLSLEKEWKLSIFFENTGLWIEPDERYFSQPQKLIFFASLISVLTAGGIFLVVNKDLSWLQTVGRDISIKSARRSILIEVVFVMAVILGHLINLIVSYSRNFRHFLDRETRTLKAATKGNLEARVPVSSNDEFGEIAKHTNLMVSGLKQRTEELQQTRDITILSLASLAETRDNETGNHILRTQRYVKTLAEHLKNSRGFEKLSDDEIIDLLYKSAPLHDIGKVGIPDHILLKPGKLTDEEFEIMKNHTVLGDQTLTIAEERLGFNSFLRIAREIAISHHERWDGKGYPKGLKGEQIPVSGRLMAVADVYDALISKRVYKPAYSHEEARGIIADWREKNFDPRVVDAFFDTESEFRLIAGEFRDKA